jgi:hypothetical protein
MSRRTGGALAAALLAVVSTAVGLSLTVGAAAVSSRNDPAANVSLPVAVLDTEVTACRAEPIDDSTACTNAILAEIDYGRASEGLPAMTLPSNWGSLSVPEQIFVVVDLERAARGPGRSGPAAPAT